MHRVIRNAAIVAAAGALLAGCGSSSKSDSSSGGPTVDLTAANISFDRTQIDVKAGAVTFVVKNNDKIEHNLTVDNGGVNKDVEGGRTVSAKATLKAGTYQFHCEYHPAQMKGTIVVS
jgi:plastocyanin